MRQERAQPEVEATIPEAEISASHGTLVIALMGADVTEQSQSCRTMLSSRGVKTHAPERRRYAPT